jgi:UDP-N-acetylglucosamine 2-epimerase (non-hydrolysing)
MAIPKPDILLSQNSASGCSLGKLTSSISQVIKDGNYSGVIVFGDVDSTLAGALAARKNGSRLIHIESGLRSFDSRMPEEKNRIVTDHLSDMLLVTEQSGVDNLVNEGIEESKIHLVGNLMIESLEMYSDVFNNSTIINSLGLEGEDYVVCTIHRAENTNNKISLLNIFSKLDELSRKFKIILPIHPGTRKKLELFGMLNYLNNLQVIEPVGYIDFIKLVKEAKGVITDSGGIQEETSHLNVPCCTLRDNTERPVTINMGTNKLFSIQTSTAGDIERHLMRSFENIKIPLWDDGVSSRIVEVL